MGNACVPFILGRLLGSWCRHRRNIKADRADRPFGTLQAQAFPVAPVRFVITPGLPR
jgi:hypothetical protein